MRGGAWRSRGVVWFGKSRRECEKMSFFGGGERFWKCLIRFFLLVILNIFFLVCVKLVKKIIITRSGCGTINLK